MVLGGVFARVIVMVPPVAVVAAGLTVAVKDAGGVATVPIDVVIGEGAVGGLVIVTKICACWPHKSVTFGGDNVMTGAGVGGSAVPGETVRVG